MRITFFGAARQVTGSCFLLEAAGLRLLVDCGLHQERSFLERNWAPFPIPPETIDFLLLTHAHLDHSGLIPKIVREGFPGPVLTTSPTADLLAIALTDSAKIQEEDAAFKKKRHKKEGRKGPHPEIPLYTTEDVERAMPLVEDVEYGRILHLSDEVDVRFHDAGHILGSAMIEVTARENGAARTVIFSGDMGQWDKPFVGDPTVFRRSDYVLMEATYGDRIHEDPMNVEDLLAAVVKAALESAGNVVIPTFAIERAQDLMYHFSRLVHGGRIPELPVFLDSPMAREVTEVFRNHPEYLDEEARRMIERGDSPFEFPGLKIVRSIEESKAINDVRGTAIIMAGSGMCTGGRVKHHLFHNLPRTGATVLFVGYQARETLGRHILEGATEVRIHGQTVPVRARVKKINGFSAHADRRALDRWLDAFERPPREIFLCHGDEDVIARTAQRLETERAWKVSIPGYRESRELD
jgi:metallo-beta-lactamase family protein